MVITTEAYEIVGGFTIFQWQPKEFSLTHHLEMHTSGLDPQGNLQHNYPLSIFNLVPLGHWNWKWNSTLAKYPTYEQ